MKYVQKRASLTAVISKACLQGWPLTGIWELGFQESSPHSLTAVTGYAINACTNNTVYAEHLLSFWESRILICAREKVSMSLVPSKNPRKCAQ